MGYVRGFLHGGVVGVVAGICIAPQPGNKTREQLSSFSAAARDGYSIAETTWRRVAPLVGVATSAARGRVDRVRGETTASGGGVRIHDETNGRR